MSSLRADLFLFVGLKQHEGLNPALKVGGLKADLFPFGFETDCHFLLNERCLLNV